MIRTGLSLIAFLLCLILSASIVHAEDLEIYLYDPDVNSIVNIQKYLSTGEVDMKNADNKRQRVTLGPAPAPYPQINVWETDFEQLGGALPTIHGIYFHNAGTFWVKKKWALIVWKIVIPQPSMRFANEFEQDITLSMWVDWNQNEAWGKNELMVRKHINLQEYFPNDAETMTVWSLTKFRVADLEDFMQSDKWQNKDLRKLWVRGVLSCDDPDVSPDGEQVFGEYQDYMVTYMVTGKELKLD
ncbi:MAG: hypothetical protein ACXADB_14205 [Candidatus Hermodarchaeia archaeon]|jgi:hypothetical protein